MEGKEMCPFCPMFLDDVSMWQPIGRDFFGDSATIGNIPACGDCASIVTDERSEQQLVAMLHRNESSHAR